MSSSPGKAPSGSAQSGTPTGPQHLGPSRPSSSQPLPGTGLRVPSNRKTIYDRNLNRSRNAELSRASFAYLFMEMVTYAQRRVTGIQDLERRLNEQAHPLGQRLLDLLLYRASQSSTPVARPLRILPLLQLIHGQLWRLLFSRPADSLEQSVNPQTPNEYMIIDNEPLVNTYISVPKEMSQLNCAAYVAGIVEGVCDGCGFEAKVSAHNQGNEMWPGKTVFLIRFEESVMEREKVLERSGIK